MTLRLRIFLFNLISVFLATFVVALIGLKIVESTLVKNTYDRLTQIRLAKAEAIERYFQDLEAAVKLISMHEACDDLLKSPTKLETSEFQQMLDSYVRDFNMHEMVVLNPEGRVVYSFHRDKTAIDKSEILAAEFKRSLNSPPGTILFKDFPPHGPQTLSQKAFISTPIHRKGKTIGAIVVEISTAEIDKIASDKKGQTSQGVGLTDETLVYAQEGSLRSTSRFAINTNDAKAIESLNDLREVGIDYRGEKVIRSIGKIHLPHGDFWYIQSKIDESEAFNVLEKIAMASGAAAILIFLLFSFATFVATSKVVEPLQLLADRLEDIGTINLTQKISYNSKDEIGNLVSKYNQLADRLQTTTVSKEFLDSVIQSIKAFLFIVKVTPQENWQQSTYRITQANESVLRFTGFSAQQIEQISLKSLIKGPKEFYDPNWLLQTRHNIEAELLNRDGYRLPVLINWAPLPHHGNQELTFVFVCTDITERINTERALIMAREQAIKDSHTKSEFLARMSHEIRTPLNSILGITDILSEADLKPEHSHLIKICSNAGENLHALINDILDISKIEAREVHLEKIAFDLPATTISICDILRQKASEKNLAFSLSLRLNNAPNPLITGDPTRLRQILFNLIGNAIKFTEAGEISVTLEFTSSDRKHLCFTVRDTGIGIPAEKQHLLFQSFVQADSSITRKYGGTGLGLTISKNLVELMGGRIWFESTENMGSTFYFTIPFVPADQASVFQDSEEKSVCSEGIEDSAGSRNTRILIVDDTEDNRFLLLTYLKKQAYDIVQAENGFDAVERIFREPFDLVLMDIQMPVMDGYAATQKIREWESFNNRSPMPIIAVSANAMPEDIRKSLAVGCTEHITKPVKKSALMDMIQRYT